MERFWNVLLRLQRLNKFETKSQVFFHKTICDKIKRKQLGEITMEVNEILRILEEMNVAVIATADENNQPHARHIHIGVANEKRRVLYD